MDQTLKMITLRLFSIISRGDVGKAVTLGARDFGFGSINDVKLEIHFRLGK